jgi:hypothetical protein
VEAGKLEKIVYFGNDDRFFNSYKKGIEKFINSEVDSLVISTKKGNWSIHLALDCLLFAPDLIVFDFGENHELMSKLTMLLNRSFPISEIPRIAVLNEQNDNEEMIETLSFYGLDYLFFKLPEIDFLVVPTVLLFESTQARFEEYFVSTPEKNYELKIKVPGRMSLFDQKKLVMESNITFEKDSFFEMSSFLREDVLFKEVSHERSRLYYNFNIKHELEFISAYEKKIEELESPDKPEDKKLRKKFQEKIAIFNDKVFSLLNNPRFKKESRVKGLKVLIIDQKALAYQQSKSGLDESTFSVRLVRKIDLDGKVIKKVDPEIIIVCLWDDSDIENLNEVFKSTQSTFIVVFDQVEHSDIDYKSLLGSEQKKGRKLLYSKASFSFDLVSKMVSSLLAGSAPKEDYQGRICFSKKSEESFCFVLDTCEIISVSEPFVIFKSKFKFEERTMMLAQFEGVRVIFTVIPTPKQYEKYVTSKEHHFAFLSGLGEEDQKMLRTIIHRKDDLLVE